MHFVNEPVNGNANEKAVNGKANEKDVNDNKETNIDDAEQNNKNVNDNNRNKTNVNDNKRNSDEDVLQGLANTPEDPEKVKKKVNL